MSRQNGSSEILTRIELLRKDLVEAKKNKDKEPQLLQISQELDRLILTAMKKKQKVRSDFLDN